MEERTVVIEALTSWPDPAYLVHGIGDTLPIRHKVNDQMACLVFDSERIGDDWINSVSDSFELDFELIPTSIEDCLNILSHMKTNGVALIWVNPPVRATYDAVLHGLDTTLGLLRQLRDG